MTLTAQGSTWKKWDLHVHTPESLVHRYPGEKETAWEAFLSDLEALPNDFKVLGINDYLFVDGYKRILHEKDKGRLKNIDLFLPVVELRLDKFGGAGNSGWSRINIHVIFDQVDPEFIRQQFISAISPCYTLIPGSLGEGRWNHTISKESLAELGRIIIDSVPVERRSAFGSPLMEGFNNLNVGWDRLQQVLNNQSLKGKFLIALGKTEWENLKWDDHTIAEKKTLINSADIIFTASESPSAYANARAKLQESCVNHKLLDCSDAHTLSSSSEKDRIGNCFTWIKADSTFPGLTQAIQEFDDRVFIGDNPQKRQIIDQNRTKFIDFVKIAKTEDATLEDPWFDVEIPLNHDLVAIIGNKGSGKSALSDIIALAGNTKHFKGFSFLTEQRFRSAKSKLARQFKGTLVWHDGNTTSQGLDKDPVLSSVERVKYLPQSYLENLCNELGDGGSAMFDAELRKIIYSHVPDAARFGKASMDDLLAFKVAEIDQARQAFRIELGNINEEIIEAEKRSTQEFKQSLVAQLEKKQSELSSVEANKPPAVEDPYSSIEAQEESKQSLEQLDSIDQEIKNLNQEEKALLSERADASKKQAIAKKAVQAISNFKKQHDLFMVEFRQLLEEFEISLPIEKLISLKIDPEPINKASKELQSRIEAIDSILSSTEPDSFLKRRENLESLTKEVKAKLGERQRQFVLYKEAIANWELSKKEITGSLENPGSIEWLKNEIHSLDGLPTKIEELKKKRKDQSQEIHAHLQIMVEEYRRLYGPVQSFVNSPEQNEIQLPLDFHAQIEETGFQEQFLERLNRQFRGSFSGIEESNQIVRNILNEADLTTPNGAISFAEKIDSMLAYDHRDGQQLRPTRLEDQLRKGITPQEVLNFLYGFDYLQPKYSLTYDGQEISQLSPGERGLLLLVFYLLVDKDDIPLVIDQPEENLDNQTIYKILVKCIKKTKRRRQVIIVTHNPNLAVVCDAEQLIYASCDKNLKEFCYECGAIEHPHIKSRVVEILEGTQPAFMNRQGKYNLQ